MEMTCIVGQQDFNSSFSFSYGRQPVGGWPFFVPCQSRRGPVFDPIPAMITSEVSPSLLVQPPT